MRPSLLLSRGCGELTRLILTRLDILLYIRLLLIQYDIPKNDESKATILPTPRIPNVLVLRPFIKESFCVIDFALVTGTLLCTGCRRRRFLYYLLIVSGPVVAQN